MKFTDLIKNANLIVSVRDSENTVETQKSFAKTLAAGAITITCIAGSIAPNMAEARNYDNYGYYNNHRGYTYQVDGPIYGTVVRVRDYKERYQNHRDRYLYEDSQFQRRHQRAQDEAARNISNLIGNIAADAVRDHLRGLSNGHGHNRQIANIGGRYAGNVARAITEPQQRHYNQYNQRHDNWQGNIRVVDDYHAMSIVTLDINYPNGRVERIEVKQPQQYSRGLSIGDEVKLELIIDRYGQSQFVTIETPESRFNNRRNHHRRP